MKTKIATVELNGRNIDILKVTSNKQKDRIVIQQSEITQDDLEVNSLELSNGLHAYLFIR